VSSERELGVRRTSAQLWQRLKPLARQMRREPTQAEAALWQRLRGRSYDPMSVRVRTPTGCARRQVMAHSIAGQRCGYLTP
jgi:very-short-patch-repair endonuclease